MEIPKRSYKATLIVDTKKLSISTEINLAKIKPPRPEIEQTDNKGNKIMRKPIDKSTGKPILNAGYCWINEKGKIIPTQQRKTFFNGKEVASFKQTKKTEVISFLDRNDLFDYAIESVYTMWSEDGSLYKLFKKLKKNKEIAVIRWTFGGFKQYYGLIVPIEKKKGYSLACYMTQTELDTVIMTDKRLKKKKKNKKKLPTINDVGFKPMKVKA